MLHKETVAPQTLDLINKLLTEEQLKDFLLVGGTALSLQVGHRISIDIDLFSNKPFDSNALAAHLSRRYRFEGAKILSNGVFCFINDIKVDLMSHQYPWIKPPIILEGVRMASLEDIGAMKLHAIVQDGSRLKDFVDVYTLVEHLPLEIFTSSYEQKYPDARRSVAHKALLYHTDIKPATIDYIGQDLKFEQIIERLKEAVTNTQKLFPSKGQKEHKRRRGRGL